MGRRAAALSFVAVLAGFDDVCAQDVGAASPPGSPAAEGGAGLLVYPAAFFAEFKPGTANDMIARVPGFTFNKGDDVRGFGGAAGNVLIDGERPSSKSVTLDQVLQRISAGSVERIELIRGGAPGIDMQGQPVVANVIRKTGAASTLAVQSLFKPYADGEIGIIPRVEQGWRRGPLSIDSQIGGRFDRNPDAGDGALTRRRADGTAYEAGEFDSEVRQRTLNGSVAGEYRRTADTFRLNAALERADTRRSELGVLADSSSLFFSELTRIKLRNDKAEIGGDYQRALTPWLGAQVIALKTFKRDKQGAFSQSRSPTQVSSEGASSGETILRGVLTATASRALRLEAGGEGAFNYLDAASALTVGGAPVVLPSANVRVEERRAEGFVTATWTASSRFSVESGLRWEVSTIRQTGGADQSKTLSFPKPRLIASYSPDAASQLRLRVERTVGQLNFKDFAATAQLDAGTVNAGNPDLEPERAWLFEAAVERRFWKGGAIVLTLSHAEVQQVVDLIPIAGRFDAPGNIGGGRRDEAKLSLTLPLDRLGVKGGLIRFNGTWRRSTVTDPVTDRPRRISYQHPFDGDVYIGKSLPKLNSTLAVEGALGFSETAYRINEVRTVVEQPLWKIYWDWSPRPDLIFRFQVENFTAKTRSRYRTLYAGPRSLNAVSFNERRTAELGPFLMMRVRKTFS